MRVTTYASMTVAIQTSYAAFFPFRRFLFSLLFHFYGVYRDDRMTRADTDADDNRGSWFRPAKSSWDVFVGLLRISGRYSFIDAFWKSRWDSDICTLIFLRRIGEPWLHEARNCDRMERYKRRWHVSENRNCIWRLAFRGNFISLLLSSALPLQSSMVPITQVRG